MIESVRRFAMAPEVVEAIARAARQRMTEELSRQREELKGINIRVRNARSQLARGKNLEPARAEELREVVAAGEAQAEELRSAVERGDRLRFDDRLVREQMASFDDLWTTLSVERQAGLLRNLMERVGYDARGDKVKVIYNSNGIREFCNGGAR